MQRESLIKVQAVSIERIHQEVFFFLQSTATWEQFSEQKKGATESFPRK